MTKTIIRAAVQDDAEALSQLAQETFTRFFGPSMLASDLAAHLEANLSPEVFAVILARDTVLIAELEGQMAGFVQFGRAGSFAVANCDDDRAVRKMYVRARFQNRTIGSALMEAALAQLHGEGAGRVFLDVWDQNYGAIRFYQRHGFKVIGERPFTVASGAETTPDLIMMRDFSGLERPVAQHWLSSCSRE